MKTKILAGSVLLSLLSWGCSPAAPPTAKGSAHYSIDFASSDLPACGVTSVGGIGKGENVPDLPTGQNPPTYFGEEVIDGEPISGGGFYVVECLVSGNSSHKIEVRMEGPNTSPQKGSATGITKIEVNGTIGADGIGTASVNYRTTAGGAGYNVETVPCTLVAVPDEAHPGEFLVGDGDARFTFLCKETILPQAELGRCEVKGTIAVRDCVDN